MPQNRGELHRHRLEALATCASINRGCGPPWKRQAAAFDGGRIDDPIAGWKGRGAWGILTAGSLMAWAEHRRCSHWGRSVPPHR